MLSFCVVRSFGNNYTKLGPAKRVALYFSFEIRLQNVSDAKKDVTKQVNEIEDFLELVINCHLIAAPIIAIRTYAHSQLWMVWAS